MKRGAKAASSAPQAPPAVTKANANQQAYWSPLKLSPEDAGSQARFLSRLIKEDIPVLPGFVLRPKAFEEYLLIHDLDEAAKEAIGDALEILKKEAAEQFAEPRDLFQFGLVLSISLQGPLGEVLTPVWGVGSAASVADLAADQILGPRESPAAVVTEPRAVLFQAISRFYAWWSSGVMRNMRRIQNLPQDMPISIIIQAAPCAAGDPAAIALKLTSRHPYSGEAKLYGSMYPGTVLEDPAYHSHEGSSWDEGTALKGKDRAEAAVLVRKVETLLKTMSDVCLTFLGGKFWVTRAHPAPGGVEAVVRTTMDLYHEGVLSPREAILAIRPEDLEQTIRKKLSDSKKDHQLARGRAITSGWVRGVIAFDPDDAGRLREEQESPVILCVEKLGHIRREMLFGLDALVALEGAVSPQVVSVCMARNIPCIVGLSPGQLRGKGRLDLAGKHLVRGDMAVLDADTGVLYDGRLAPTTSELPDDVKTLLALTEEVSSLKVRANVATPQEAAMARALGADGVGLLRTEHLFRSDRRKNVMVQVIMARTAEDRRRALEELLPIQRNDFKQIFQELPGAKITVRLLDPPLSNYLPTYEDMLQELNEARLKGDFSISEEKEHLVRKLFEIRETNPMLGLRGCRLGILYPEIYEIQVKAIYEAALDLRNEGIEVLPEILVPFVSHEQEIKVLAHVLERAVAEVQRPRKSNLPFVLGVMIETPRSAMVAGKLAEFVDFFSIGSNDLTQLAYGMCRDDAEGRFLLTFLDRGIYPANPFETIDREGVGRLIRLAIQDGRWVNSKLGVGLAGAQAVQTDTVAFALETGMDYLSCPVTTLPVVKLMAAQVALRKRGA